MRQQVEQSDSAAINFLLIGDTAAATRSAIEVNVLRGYISIISDVDAAENWLS